MVRSELQATACCDGRPLGTARPPNREAAALLFTDAVPHPRPHPLHTAGPQRALPEGGARPARHRLRAPEEVPPAPYLKASPGFCQGRAHDLSLMKQSHGERQGPGNRCTERWRVRAFPAGRGCWEGGSPLWRRAGRSGCGGLDSLGGRLAVVWATVLSDSQLWPLPGWAHSPGIACLASPLTFQGGQALFLFACPLPAVLGSLSCKLAALCGCVSASAMPTVCPQ